MNCIALPLPPLPLQLHGNAKCHPQYQPYWIAFTVVSVLEGSAAAAAAATKSLQSCPTLCDPMDGSPPGSPVPGILQARTLEWAAISFSNGGKWKVKVKSLSRVWLLATPWTAAFQAPPSMGFSRKSTGVGCHYLLHEEAVNVGGSHSIQTHFLILSLIKMKLSFWKFFKVYI